MKRHQDWRARLSACLADRAAMEFAPGLHDCALFVAAAVEAMTGRDFARAYRGKYDSEAHGLRRLRRNKHADHVDLAAKLLPEIPPALAREGDVAVINMAGSDLPALGVVQGESIYVAAPWGLSIISRGQMVRAFRVGE